MQAFVFFFSFFISLLSFAGTPKASGGSDVGGGMGVVCKDKQGTITSVELLDLWEARVIFGRRIVSSNDTPEIQIDRALDQLQYAVYKSEVLFDPFSSEQVTGAAGIRKILKGNVDRFLSPNSLQIRRLHGARLNKTNDSYEIVRPKECKIEQLVRYIDTNRGGFVMIDQDLVDKMDSTNIAALYLHEVFYAHLRPYEGSSIRARRTIGYIFAGNQFLDFDKLLPTDYISCVDDPSFADYSLNKVLIFLTSDPKHGTVANLQLLRLNGLETIGYENNWVHWDAQSLSKVLYEDKSVISASGTMGTETGFDYIYTYTILFSSVDGKIEVYLQLSQAPDQSQSQKLINLKCDIVKKRSY